MKHIEKKRKLSTLLKIFALLGLTCGTTTIYATELANGTIIDASNLDAHLQDTYEGKVLSSMLTDGLVMNIRKYGLRMKLAPTRRMQPDPRYLEATKRYSGQVKYDTKTKTISGYVAGIPFPKLDMEDPDAGWKLAWNLFYAIPTNADNSAVGGPISIVNFEGGKIREFTGDNYKFRMVGRYTDTPPGHRGDGSIKQKSVVALSAPYDLAGLGVYTVQKANGEPDDAFVYVRAIRRIKRTAGAAVWMDNQPQMDLLNDDNNGLDSYPRWYKDFKVIGKRWVLAVSYIDPIKKSFEEMIEQRSPWINPNPTLVVWRPIEVFVLQGTPPDEHPYSRKILYVGVDYPQPYAGDFYNKAGQLWRMWRLWITSTNTGGSYKTPSASYVQAIDFIAQRATFINGTGIWVLNDPKFKEEMLTPEIMQRFAAGKQGVY